MEIIDRIMIEMYKNGTLINIYLDLSKAFDTLDHNIPLQKLNYYGIKEITLNFLKTIFHTDNNMLNLITQNQTCLI